jgi:hypothetical protein
MGKPETLSGATPERRYEIIAADSEADPHIVGLVLSGSRGKGAATDNSDYDIVLVVDDDHATEYARRYAKYVTAFRDHAVGWDRYSYAHAKARVDKLEGQIQTIMDEKGRLRPDEIPGVINGCCDHYVNQFYRALKCLRDGNRDAAKLELAESVGPLLAAMFALHGRLNPYYKYLEWELQTYPLTLFPWQPARLYSLVVALSSEVSPLTIKEVLRETDRVFRQHGHGAVFDGWGDDLAWMMGE